MHRTLAALALAALVALAAVAAAPADTPPNERGVDVRVRVEGRTQTIFGAAEPRLSAATALGALESASAAGEFFYRVQESSFGRYVDQIGRYPAGGAAGWVFKVNGASPPVGADAVTLKAGDRVLWYWADFGSGSGPATLRLVPQRGNCYRVLKEDDNGRTTAAAGAVLRVDGRRVRTRAGRACVGRHRSLVRATLAGTVRSNAVR